MKYNKLHLNCIRCSKLADIALYYIQTAKKEHFSIIRDSYLNNTRMIHIILLFVFASIIICDFTGIRTQNPLTI